MTSPSRRYAQPHAIYLLKDLQRLAAPMMATPPAVRNRLNGTVTTPQRASQLLIAPIGAWGNDKPDKKRTGGGGSDWLPPPALLPDSADHEPEAC